MSMNKIKAGDTVIVLAGKDRGRTGSVLRLNGSRCLVEGVNLIKKHLKPNPQKNIQGGIVEKEAFMNVSNVAILNSQSNKADRVGFKVVDGKKLRYFKSSGELIDI